MAGGGARRGTLVVHYVTGYRPTSAPRPRQPRGGTGSCGSQPAYQSLIDRRLQRRLRPCTVLDRTSCFRTDRETNAHASRSGNGHESGQMQTEDTQRLAGPDAESTSSGAEARVPTVGVAPLGAYRA